MITLMISLFSVVVLYFILRGVSRMNRGTANAKDHLGQVDLDAFINLLDERQQDFMRSHLSAAEYRKFERERDHVLLAYVDSLSQLTASRIQTLTAPGFACDPGLMQNLLQTRQMALRTGVLLRVSLWAPEFLHLARRGRAACQALADSCGTAFAAERQLSAVSQR